MSGLTFKQQLLITLIDKVVIGGFLVLAAYGFNRLLAAFQATQARELESFKLSQSEKLEGFKLDQNRRLEAFKHALATESEISRNLRLAIADIAKKLAAGTHAMCWVCWIAKYSADELQLEHLQTYDKEIHLILSDIVGARVVLAALHEPTHAELSPLIDRLYSLDVDMGEAKTRFLKDKPAGLAALAKLHSEAVIYDCDLLEAVTALSAFKKEQGSEPAA